MQILMNMRIDLLSIIIIDHRRMSSPDTLLKYYNTILVGSTTEAIKQAERTLLQLEDDPNFLQDNVLILNEPQIAQPVKKLSAVYLNKYSKSLIKEKSPNRCVAAIQQYLSLLRSAQIDIDLKPLVVVAIDTLVSSEANKAVKLSMSQNLIAAVRQAVKQPDANINYAYLVFYAQSLFSNHSYFDEIRDLLKNVFGQFVALTLRLHRAAADINLENRQNLLTIAKLIREYSILLKAFMKKLALLDVQTAKYLFLPDFQAIISTVFQLNLKENTAGSTLFMNIPQEEGLSKIFNKIKSNYLMVLTSFIRLMHSYVKHPGLINTNPLYIKLPTLIDYFIKSTVNLLQQAPYYQLPSRTSIIEVLDQCFNLLVTTLRMNDFYPIFQANNNDIIEKMILPCLALTPHDIDNFYDSHEEFVLQAIQIIERDVKNVGMGMVEEEQDQIKQYETVKTFASELLSTLCKYQDGILSHIFDFALGVIQGKIGTTFSKSLMFLIISILRTLIKDRKDLKTRVSEIILRLIGNTPIPVITNVRKEQDVEYAYLLLTLSKIILTVKQTYPNVISQAFKIAVAVIQSPSIGQAHRYFTLQLMDEMTRIDEGQVYAFEMLSIYNHLLTKYTDEPSFKLLDSYFLLIKYNQEEFKKNPAKIVEGIHLLCLHIEREVKKPEPTQLFLNKCWNIIREVGESDEFIPALIPQIQEAVLPLLTYIDGIRNFDFEEDILLLLTSFISRGRQVTLSQQKMFEIIPRVFYNQYACRFGHAFHTIQIFIYYGSDILINCAPAIQAIIEMAVAALTLTSCHKKPINQAQNCEGVLLLQSLVLKCWPVLTLDQWTFILKALLKRLQCQQAPIKFNLLSSNIYASLSLILFRAHTFFSDEENQILITKILSNIKYFNRMHYSPKVVIAGLSQLLLLFNCPFVGRRFTHVLDIVVMMLEISSMKKDRLFDEEDEEEEKEYANSLIMIKNDIKDLDEFKYFKDQVLKLKQGNTALLVNSIAELPQSKRDFLNDILRVERVMNEPRKIFKIKR